MCCDGTLIGFVKVDKQEAVELKKIMDVEGSGPDSFFFTPCSMLCNGCQIYASRPENCRKFKCKVLSSMEAGNVTFDQASELISLLKGKRRKMEELLLTSNIQLNSKSFYFKMAELKKLLHIKRSNSALLMTEKSLFDGLEELDSIMTQYFGIDID